MIVSDIRKRVTGGFQPFLIRTSDGREFKFPHPEFIIVGLHSVAVADEEGDITTITFLHIVSPKDLPPRGKSRSQAAWYRVRFSAFNRNIPRAVAGNVEPRPDTGRATATRVSPPRIMPGAAAISGLNPS